MLARPGGADGDGARGDAGREGRLDIVHARAEKAEQAARVECVACPGGVDERGGERGTLPALRAARGKRALGANGQDNQQRRVASLSM